MFSKRSTMIHCPNCNFENGDLAVICVSCGGFLQARVPTLDLFSTVWQLIEAPRQAMRRIALASHKNYLVLLSCLYGISLAFFFMWMFSLGEEFENILYLIFAALAVGPLLGVLHIGLIGVMGAAVSRLIRVRLRIIDLLGVAAYASVPILFALVFILPIEILTFGLYMFSENPSPFVIKPASYVILVTLDAICILWSLRLFVTGVRVIGNLSVWKTIVTVILAVGLSFLAVLVILRLVLG